MKILNNIKTLFTRDIEKAISLPMSALGKAWDLGADILGLGSKKGRPSKAYAQVDWVWICANLIIDVASSIQLMLSTDKDDIVESGPIYDFFFNNPDMKYSELFKSTVGFYTLFREVYLITLESTGTRPTKLLVAGPNSVKPVVKSGVLLGYELHTVDGKTVPLFTEDVYCIKNFNPYDPHRGCGPLTAGEMAISTAYQATQFSEASLANGARLSTILSTPPGVTLTDDEKKALKSEFRAQHEGARNTGKTFLATGGLTVESVSQTMRELQMVDLTVHSAKTVCSLFGVPPECVGLNTEAQYASGPASQRLITNGIAPVLSAIAEGFNDCIVEKYNQKHITAKLKSVPLCLSKHACGSRQPLLSRFYYRRAKLKSIQSAARIFAWFDIDSHPAIQDMLRERAEKMIKYIEKGVPLNQVIDAGDLPFERVPWGDDHWINPSLVPAQWVLDAGPESFGEPTLPEGGEEKPDEEAEKKEIAETDPSENKNNAQAKLRIWKKWTQSWAGIEKEYTQAIRVLFIGQGRRLQAKLKKALDDLKSDDRLKADADIIARVVFDLAVENGKIKAIHKTFFEKAVRLGAAQTVNESVGTTGDALKQAVEAIRLRPAVKQSLAVSSHKITKVNTTTQNRVAKQLAEGLQNGEGLSDLAKRIQAVTKDSLARSQSIARTQTASAVSTGRHEGLASVGVKLKAWLTSGDPQVRAAHQAAGTTYQKGIPVNDPFIVAGEALMYPGDPNGSAGNIINCRCLELARAAAGKTFDLAHYDRVKFIDYTDMKTLFSEV